jgi:hypothetical protein
MGYLSLRKSSRRGGYPPRPSRTRTCGFPASGSSPGRFAPESRRRGQLPGPSGPPERSDPSGPALLSVVVSWTRTQVAEYLACFLPTALPAWCLLPSPGSPWVGCPKFNGTTRHCDFPVPVPSDLWIRRSAPAPALVFARSGTRTLPAAWLLGLRSGAVRPLFSAGNTGTSQVPGMPLQCLCPAL